MALSSIFYTINNQRTIIATSITWGPFFLKMVDFDTLNAIYARNMTDKKNNNKTI